MSSIMVKANLNEHMVHLSDFAFSDSQKYSDLSGDSGCVEALV